MRGEYVIMITPSQIKDKVLSTASHGYDIDETNEFLQQIEESFSTIYDENKELYRKMEVLASKIEEYRSEEDSIKDTLLTAQKAASKVEKEAKEKSEKLLSESAKTVQNTVMDAKAKAEKIISEAREYASQITKEKADAAQSILNEAHEKADKELADAKADAAALLTESKNISQELLSKSQNEKVYYDNLTNNLKKEAESFKEKLVSLYEAQLEKLTEMMESPVTADNAQIDEKIDENQQNIETVSAKIDEMEQNIAQSSKDSKPDEPQEDNESDKQEATPSSETENQEEAHDKEAEKPQDDFDVEYELEEISKADEQPQEEPEEADVHEAINAFSQDPEDGGASEISEEPEMEQTQNDEEKEQHLPFEDFFHIKPEGVRTSEKISLIPPDEDEDDDDDGNVKFKGFFKKKRK